jgi:hypothetical protein
MPCAVCGANPSYPLLKCFTSIDSKEYCLVHGAAANRAAGEIWYAEGKESFDTEMKLLKLQRENRELEASLPPEFPIKYTAKNFHLCRVCEEPTEPVYGTKHLRFCSELCYRRARRSVASFLPPYEWKADAPFMAKLNKEEALIQAEEDEVNYKEVLKQQERDKREAERVQRELQRQQDRQARIEKEQARDAEKQRKLDEDEATQRAEEEKWRPKPFSLK